MPKYKVFVEKQFVVPVIVEAKDDEEAESKVMDLYDQCVPDLALYPHSQNIDDETMIFEDAYLSAVQVAVEDEHGNECATWHDWYKVEKSG